MSVLEIHRLVNDMNSCHAATVANEFSAVARATHGTASLVLHRVIEQTVDSLTAIRNTMDGMSESLSIFCGRIRESKPATGDFLDANDEGINLLQEAYQSLEAELPKLLLKKSTIDRDPLLSADHRELLHSAYDEATDAIASLIEATKELRAAVIGHDLAAESREIATYDDPRTLIAALHEPV